MQSQAQPGSAPGFHRTLQTLPPCYKEAGSAQNPTISIEHPSLVLVQSPIWARIAALFVLYTPNKDLLLLCSTHTTPWSHKKGAERRRDLYYSLKPMQWFLPLLVDLRMEKLPCPSTDTPPTTQRTREGESVGWEISPPCSPIADARLLFSPTYLNGLVEDAVPNLDHLEVLLLLVACTFDVGHPAAVILLAGVDEIPHCAVLVEHLRGDRALGGDAAHRRLNPSTSCLWNKAPGQGQAQSQHSLGAEILTAAGRSQSRPALCCCSAARLRNVPWSHWHGCSCQSLFPWITQLLFSISFLIRAPPATQPQRKGLFSILQLPWERENPWVDGEGACQAWKDAWQDARKDEASF